MRRTSGFTLLELTVVLTLSGLLLRVAIPRYSALRAALAVRSAMGDVGGAFSLARQTALARRELVTVAFDTSRAVVQVRTVAGVVLTRALGTAYGVGLTANRDSAVYDPRGWGYGLSNLTVTVRRDNFVDTLTMSRMGRVRW